MNHYKIRVHDNGRQYTAQVQANYVETDPHNNLIFSTTQERVATFASGTWVYFKKIKQEDTF